MATELPKVTIIIPYKTDRGFLDVAIKSVKAQDYKGEIELILSQSDNSVSYNINRAVEKATGSLIKYLCEDDYLPTNSITDSVEAIQGFDFIHGKAFIVRGEVIQTQIPRLNHPTLADMIEANVIHGGTLMYRKDVFDRIGLFDETLTCAEEYDFNMRCMANGMKLNYCPKTLYYYRRHDQQKSLGQGVDQEKRKLKIEAIKDRFR